MLTQSIAPDHSRPLPAAADPVHCRWLPAADTLSAGVRSAWDALVARSDNPYQLFQSPEWWDYLARSEYASRCSLGVASTSGGQVVGVVPLRFGPCNFPFAVGSRALYAPQLRAAQPLGNQPLTQDDDPTTFVAIVRALFETFVDCDCIEFQCLPIDSPWWRAAAGGVFSDWAVSYALDANINNYVIRRPPNVADVLHKFKPKTRYNLRRQIRRLREYGGGRLELQRIERAADVQAFLDAAVPLTAVTRERYRGRNFRLQNDAAEHQKLMAAADAGILRSYLLHCGGRVCAYVKGFQQRDIFYYHQIGFDEALARFSPGIVMLQLMIEDLFAYAAPQRINLYSGDSTYKQQFASDVEPCGRLVLLRRNLSNRILVSSHAVLGYCLRRAKSALGSSIEVKDV